MKLIYFNLMLISISLFAQEIKFIEFESPQDLIQSQYILKDNIPQQSLVFKSIVGRDIRATIFDGLGNIVAKFDADPSDKKNEYIDIDYSNQRIVVFRPILGNEPIDGTLGVFPIKVYHQEIFDFSGNLLLTHESADYWITPISREYYASVGGGDEYHFVASNCFILDKEGKIIKEVPELKAAQKLHTDRLTGITLMCSNIDKGIWAIDSTGEILWKQNIYIPFPENFSFSRDGTCCFGYLSYSIVDGNKLTNKPKVIIIDKTGNIKHNITVSEKAGNVMAAISDNGQKVTWVFKETIENYKTAKNTNEIVLFDIDSAVITFKKDVSQNNFTILNCQKLGFLDKAEKVYALFSTNSNEASIFVYNMDLIQVLHSYSFQYQREFHHFEPFGDSIINYSQNSEKLLILSSSK